MPDASARTGTLRPGVDEREARHRRRLLFVVGILLLAATSPVMVHHATSGVGTPLDGRDHLWSICLIALHQLLDPVHSVFHLLLIGGVVYAVVDRARAWWRLRTTLGLIVTRTVVSTGATFHAARVAAVPTDSIRLVDGLPMPAFTIGWVRPVILVSTELEGQLSQAQLAAVLAHEYAHVRRRDPLRLTMLRALGCLLFWLPAMRRLAADVADDAEIIADDFAIRGDPVALASAILALAQWRAPGRTGDASLQHGGAIVGFQRDAMLDRRINRLLGHESSITTQVTKPSLFGAVLALCLAWGSGLAVAHPMTSHSEHCAHTRLAAYEHLFCLAGHTAVTAHDCPHHGGGD
jgi:Zn-dependent protease with chaperone function